MPGVAPHEFSEGQNIEIKAVKMTSTRTQLPYEYYSLQFCLPKNGTFVYKSENLGEVLRGDRVVNTPYELRLLENVDCRLLCNKQNQPLNWDREQSEKVAERIRDEYFVHLLVDNLPVATRIVNADTMEVQFEPGYRLGQADKNNIYINNHLKFIVSYHKHTADKHRVVGFEVETMSVNLNEIKFDGSACRIPDSPKPQQIQTQTQLYFSYSVEWKESPVK